ncbi:MAG: glycosyltransferase [Bacteroidetes bacterium]|nr:glycosyltransferase [Bacteroidota bacterium]
MNAGGALRPHIVHVFFGQVRKLSPLMAELRSLRDEMQQTLIVPDYDQDPDYLSATLPDVGIRYIRMRSRAWSARQTAVLKLLRFKEFTFRTMWALRKYPSALLVLHDMPAVLPALGILLLRPRRVVFHAHELWSEAAEQLAPLRPFWRVLERWTMRRAARVIVPEINRARIVHEEYGSPVPPVVVMNIPADPPPFARGNLLRERLLLDANALCVLYQGLLAESRCIVELVRAIGMLPEHVHLVLIGSGEASFMELLEKECATVSHRVHLLSWMHPEELRECTASADVGVLLYRNSGRNNYYAAPNKLYEYLFAGLPVVASAFPGLRAAVEGGSFGACADPADPAEIADALQRAAAITPGADIAERAHAQWRWSDQVANLRTAYLELLPHSVS